MKKEVKENEEHHLVLPDDVTVMEAARLLSPLWATLGRGSRGRVRPSP